MDLEPKPVAPLAAAGRRIGVIADTHGVLRPQAREALVGSELIIHAGDVGSLEVLQQLESIAPVVAVRGNVDVQPWASNFPESRVVEVGEARVYVVHDLEQLDLDPSAAGMAAVVCGHTHVAVIEERNGVLYVNPGSAGPRRFHHPVSVAVLTVAGALVTAELVELET
ncbi:MAG TPA: metallophosphoesterase family protein [Thermoanaerobaculaceae bacterium]|nr:metallophosphoesterase family protein [Thermoanaerobaculaceae bacterium]